MAQQTKKGKGFAITSMVCGLVSVIFAWNIFFWGFHLIEAIVALVFGIISLAQKREGKGMAITGIATAGVFLIISLFMLIFGTIASID